MQSTRLKGEEIHHEAATNNSKRQKPSKGKESFYTQSSMKAIF